MTACSKLPGQSFNTDVQYTFCMHAKALMHEASHERVYVFQLPGKAATKCSAMHTSV